MAFEWRKAQFAVFLFEHCASLFISTLATYYILTICPHLNVLALIGGSLAP